MRTKFFILINAILLFLAGVGPSWAQDATGGSGGGSAVEHSSSSSTTTTTTTEALPVDNNTILWIVLGAIAVLILVIALARSGSRGSVSKTTIVKDR